MDSKIKCECGNDAVLTDTMKVSKNPIRYLKEYKCDNCGYFICDHFNRFFMMGKISDNKDKLYFPVVFWL